MMTPGDDKAQSMVGALEEMTRKLRRERIKLERNMSGGTTGGSEWDSQVNPNATEIEPNDFEVSDPITVKNDPQSPPKLTNVHVPRCDMEGKEPINNDEKQDGYQQKHHSDEDSSSPPPHSSAGDTELHIQQPHSVFSSPDHSSDFVKSSSSISTNKGQVQPSQAPPTSASNEKGKGEFWHLSARQAKQNYNKPKSLHSWKPRVSSNDLWLIRQTPKVTGSYPDDEVSVYPDTISVMSVDTQVRSNVYIVEEVINEEGRTCYVI